AALSAAFALGIAHQGAQRTHHVDAEMLVEAPVLGGERRLDQIVRHLVERHAVIRANAAPADFGAEAVEEDDRIILRLVEGAAIDDVEGGKGKRSHQHRADGPKGEGVREDFNYEALDARDM